MSEAHHPFTFFFIAGEASGDILGAHLMRALKKKLDGKVRFAGIGGPHMQAEGIDLLFPHTELMHFGVVEVVRHIPRLLKRINQTAREIRLVQPDAVITIDSPDFCFRVVKKVRRGTGNGERGLFFSSQAPYPKPRIPLIHYVAPTVWAWRPERAKKIAKFLDHLLALFPFEPPYFTREGLGCTFVGHPLVENDADKGSNAIFRSARNIPSDTLLLTVLFGSRSGEITRLMPVFRNTVKILRAQHPDMQLAVPVVPYLKNRIATEMADWNIPFHIVEGERAKYDAFAASRTALACSGTVALELALSHLPAVIAYKINNLTAFLYRRFIRTPYANLINIMHGKEVVPEFIQENCTPQKLAQAVGLLLRDSEARQAQIAQLSTAAAWLGQGQFVPSERAAETVLSVVQGKDKQPTVLQVLPALYSGGVERGTVEVTAALTAAGFRAIVASSGGPMAHEVTQAGGIHVTLPLASKNPLTIIANITRLSHIIAQHKVDLVHARSRAPAWSAYYAAIKCGVPFVTTFHSAYGAGSAIKRWYNSVMGKGERVIAISHFVADYALCSYDIARSNLRIIARGVDIDKFAREKISPQRIDALRGTWNLTANTPVILCPARITRWKGQSVLVRALAQLKRDDFVCIIVGSGKDGTYGRELAQEIRRARLDKNVAIFDTCRDMPAAYALADVTVTPSTRPEGFGRTVIEAQAMGSPVIATGHGGAMETVIESETGWLVTPGNAEELAQAIEKALNLSPQQRRHMAARSIKHIRDNFTTANMTVKTLDVYRELLHISKSMSLDRK